MKRRKARELAVKVLYAVEVGEADPTEALFSIAGEEEVADPELVKFASELVTGALEHASEIDEIIAEYSVGWAPERTPTVDRNIMRMAIFEILHRPDIPESVSANEAVEIGKKYGDEKTGRFINGVLGKVIRELVAES